MRFICLLFLLMLLVACQEGETAVSDTAIPSVATATAIPPTETPATTGNGGPTPIPLPDTILPEDLVAYYPFNGNADDASNRGNHGTINGATLVADRLGQADSAVAFDGVDDYIEVPPGRSLVLRTEATLSLWFYHESQAEETWYTLFEKSDPERDGHSRYGLWVIRDLVLFCVEPTGNDFQRCLESTMPLIPETWHHIAATYDGTTQRVFIDGLPVGEQEYGRSGISQSNYELYIGTDLYQTDHVYIKGIMDEIRIYKRALAAEEIVMLYEAEG